MLWRANCAISVSTISDMSLHHCWPEYFCIARFNLCVILDNTLSQIFEKHPRGGGLGTYVGATRPALAPPSIRCCCRGPAVPGHRSCGQTRQTRPTPPTRSTLRHSTLRRVCSRISAALSCDTVKTRFSGSGGAGRSPARKFYGQALFSRQNLHAIRPTAPRWIALIETCTKHAKQGECGAARGLQERTCLRNAVATAMDARSCGSSRPDAKHSSSTAALVQYACTRKTRTAPPCSHAGQGRCALQ